MKIKWIAIVGLLVSVSVLAKDSAWTKVALQTSRNLVVLKDVEVLTDAQCYEESSNGPVCYSEIRVHAGSIINYANSVILQEIGFGHFGSTRARVYTPYDSPLLNDRVNLKAIVKVDAEFEDLKLELFAEEVSDRYVRKFVIQELDYRLKRTGTYGGFDTYHLPLLERIEEGFEFTSSYNVVGAKLNDLLKLVAKDFYHSYTNGNGSFRADLVSKEMAQSLEMFDLHEDLEENPPEEAKKSLDQFNELLEELGEVAILAISWNDNHWGGDGYGQTLVVYSLDDQIAYVKDVLLYAE